MRWNSSLEEKLHSSAMNYLFIYFHPSGPQILILVCCLQSVGIIIDFLAQIAPDLAPVPFGHVPYILFGAHCQQYIT